MCTPQKRKENISSEDSIKQNRNKNVYDVLCAYEKYSHTYHSNEIAYESAQQVKVVSKKSKKNHEGLRDNGRAGKIERK